MSRVFVAEETALSRQVVVKVLHYSTGGDIVEARLATSPGLRVVSRDTVLRRVPREKLDTTP